jgi:hypothetical protein
VEQNVPYSVDETNRDVGIKKAAITAACKIKVLP